MIDRSRLLRVMTCSRHGALALVFKLSSLVNEVERDFPRLAPASILLLVFFNERELMGASFCQIALWRSNGYQGSVFRPFRHNSMKIPSTCIPSVVSLAILVVLEFSVVGMTLMWRDLGEQRERFESRSAIVQYLRPRLLRFLLQ